MFSDMTNEEGTGQRIELLKLAAGSVGGRDQLLDMVRQQFQLKIPHKSSYARLLKTVLESGLETEFCQKFLKANNFHEAWTLYILAQGLALFDTGDLRKIAEFLSENSSRWKYDKANRGKIIESVLQNATHDQLAYCLNRTMSSGQIEPTVMQRRRSIAGPLGVTHSIQSRTSSMSDDLVRFVRGHFGEQHFEQFGKRLEIPLPVSQFEIPNDLTTRPLAHIQLMLTYYDDNTLFEEFNSMIQQGLLEIRYIEQYWNLMATPHGVFKESYGAEENLALAIKDYYSKEEIGELLGSKGYQYADLETGIQELCLSENPERLLLELFGRKELHRIAREKGLVAVEKAKDVSELVKVIALQLGFALPPTLEGINTFITELEKRKLRLEQYRITTAERDGLMSETFIIVEKILKDLATFYVCFLWPKTIEQYFEHDEKKRAFNELVRRELQIGRKEGLDRLMLGELMRALQRLNERVDEEESLKQRVRDTLEREKLIPHTLLSMIESACNYRPHFVHDTINGRLNIVINTRLCQNLLDDIISFAKTIANDRIYPCVLRITREITDEYGRAYVEAIDESGKDWVIKSTSWIRPEFAYYMHAPKYGFVAVDPFIIEKLR